jgi:hypothetical protein
VFTAVTAASSQDWALVPMTSMTRYTLMKPPRLVLVVASFPRDLAGMPGAARNPWRGYRQTPVGSAARSRRRPAYLYAICTRSPPFLHRCAFPFSRVSVPHRTPPQALPVCPAEDDPGDRATHRRGDRGRDRWGHGPVRHQRPAGGQEYADAGEDYYDQRDQRNREQLIRHHHQAAARLGYQVTLVPPGDDSPPPGTASPPPGRAA